MNNKYDLVIVGGGPAGLMAGCEAVGRGLTVTIVEKDCRIGYPLNCAEAISVGSVDGVLQVRPDWIKNRIERGRLVSPSGHVLELNHPGAGYIIDRPVMEQALADEFVSAGGTLMMGCRGVSLTKGDGQFESLIVVDDSDREQKLAAPVFIAADGVEGTIARLAGINNRLNLKETESFLQYRLRNVTVEPDLIEIHVGSKVAPGSYAWVFPRGGDEVTVGLGMSTADCDQVSPGELLDRFVARRFGSGEIVTTGCGTCPRYQGPDKLAVLNLLVVGDAARVLDSITGAGIANALLSGKLAGGAAAACLNDDTQSLESLYNIYPRQFVEQKHALLHRYTQIKEVMDHLSDKDLDEIVLALNDYFEPKRVDSIDPMAVFLGVIARKPRLLKLVRHLL